MGNEYLDNLAINITPDNKDGTFVLAKELPEEEQIKAAMRMRAQAAMFGFMNDAREIGASLSKVEICYILDGERYAFHSDATGHI
jgi:hypothetical protein